MKRKVVIKAKNGKNALTVTVEAQKHVRKGERENFLERVKFIRSEIFDLLREKGFHAEDIKVLK